MRLRSELTGAATHGRGGLVSHARHLHPVPLSAPILAGSRRESQIKANKEEITEIDDPTSPILTHAFNERNKRRVPATAYVLLRSLPFCCFCSLNKSRGGQLCPGHHRCVWSDWCLVHFNNQARHQRGAVQDAPCTHQQT